MLQKKILKETHKYLEHIDNNIAVREILKQRGVKPEALPAAEDVAKLKRKLEGEEKKMLKEVKKSRKK